MEIGHLRYFVAAAECGSFSRAARRCGIAQPSLSQQLKRLEKRLGVGLFDRHGRGVVLTDAGRALLPRAKRILADVHEAESSLRGEAWVETARLAIGAIPTIAPFLVPWLVASLRREHPSSEIVIREDLTENLVEALIDHEIDVALVSTPVDHPLLEIETVGSEAMLVVVPRGHALHRAGAVGVVDLAQEPAITLHEMHCLGRQIEAFCAQRSIRPPIVCRTTQLATVLELVRQKVGISIVPEMAARHDSGEGVVFLPIECDAPEREIALAWRLGRTRPALGRRVRSLVAEGLQ